MAGVAVRAVRASAPALLALGLAGLGAGVMSDGDEGGLALGRDGGFLGGGGVAQDSGGGWGMPLGGFMGGDDVLYGVLRIHSERNDRRSQRRRYHPHAPETLLLLDEMDEEQLRGLSASV